MLDFASPSDVEDEGRTAPPAPESEILDAYCHAVAAMADTVGPAVAVADTFDVCVGLKCRRVFARRACSLQNLQ